MFPLLHVAEQFAAAAQQMEPENMVEYEGWLEQLSQVFEHLGNAIKIMTIKANEQYPLDPAFVESIAAICLVQSATIPMADELCALFKAIHVQERTRQQNPRQGEHLWNPLNS